MNHQPPAPAAIRTTTTRPTRRPARPDFAAGPPGLRCERCRLRLAFVVFLAHARHAMAAAGSGNAGTGSGSSYDGG